MLFFPIVFQAHLSFTSIHVPLFRFVVFSFSCFQLFYKRTCSYSCLSFVEFVHFTRFGIISTNETNMHTIWTILTAYEFYFALFGEPQIKMHIIFNWMNAFGWWVRKNVRNGYEIQNTKCRLIFHFFYHHSTKTNYRWNVRKDYSLYPMQSLRIK